MSLTSRSVSSVFCNRAWFNGLAPLLAPTLHPHPQNVAFAMTKTVTRLVQRYAALPHTRNRAEKIYSPDTCHSCCCSPNVNVQVGFDQALVMSMAQAFIQGMGLLTRPGLAPNAAAGAPAALPAITPAAAAPVAATGSDVTRLSATAAAAAGSASASPPGGRAPTASGRESPDTSVVFRYDAVGNSGDTHDVEGYDKAGFNRRGLNRRGYDRDGRKPDHLVGETHIACPSRPASTAGGGGAGGGGSGTAAAPTLGTAGASGAGGKKLEHR